MSQIPPTVDLIIPTECVQTVITLLISNKIAFTLTSSNQTENTPKTISTLSEISHESKADFAYASIEPLSPKMSTIESICLKYLKKNIEQPIPKEAQIAAEFGISVGTINRGFRVVYGKSFYQLYIEKRLEHAKMLLLQGYKSAEVAERFGYSQPIKFNKIFQKYVGVTPKKFQMAHQEKKRTER